MAPEAPEATLKFTVLVILGLLMLPAGASAQEVETLDLVTFEPPAGWTRTDTGAKGIEFATQDVEEGTAARINVLLPLPGSSTDARANFEGVWNGTVAKTVPDSPAPTFAPATKRGGWQLVRGSAPFEMGTVTGAITLVSATGGDANVNIVVLSTSPRYQKAIEAFVASLRFKAPPTPAAPTPPSPPMATPPPERPAAVPDGNVSIVGTWGWGSSATRGGGSFGRWSYTKNQYTFDDRGRYTFVRKVYVEDDAETLLTRETGAYVVTGATITLSPSSSVIEAWSKSQGGDNYKQRVSAQNRPLEKVTYSLGSEPMPGREVMTLVLAAGKETARDGRFNNGDLGWRLAPTGPYYSAIKLPGE